MDKSQRWQLAQVASRSQGASACRGGLQIELQEGQTEVQVADLEEIWPSGILGGSQSGSPGGNQDRAAQVAEMPSGIPGGSQSEPKWNLGGHGRKPSHACESAGLTQQVSMLMTQQGMTQLRGHAESAGAD